jgi:hypothetical protein
MTGRKRRICRTCGQAAIPNVTPTRLLQYLSEAHGDLTSAPLSSYTAQDQPADDDPKLLLHRRDMALATLRYAISEASRTECLQCERRASVQQAPRQG